MKTSIKAALLSALVFPGAGHLFLKKYPVGIALGSAFSFVLYLVTMSILDKVDYVMIQIEAGHIPLDLASINALLSEQPVGMDSQSSSLMTFIMGILWLIAIADAYRVGRI